MRHIFKHHVTKPERYLYIAKRGVMRIIGWPFQQLPEGGLKMAGRRFILNFQNSVPTELAVNRGDTVVQIGTPHPATMRRFRRALGSEGKLVVVEAMPENHGRLEKAIAEDGLTNVILIQGAACNHNGEGELAVSPYEGDHKIPLDNIRMDNDLVEGNEAMDTIAVRFLRLDDELPKHGITAINYLSVTVNGAEAEVLRGAGEILKGSPAPVRVFAKGHALDENNQPIHKQSEAIMRDLGFSTKITKGEPSSTDDASWRQRAGDLFAWK